MGRGPQFGPEPIPVREEGTTISIFDWFDPYDMEHLRAYRTLHERGCWPEDFPPSHVEMTTNWQVAIMSKMADAWVEEHCADLQLEPGV